MRPLKALTVIVAIGLAAYWWKSHHAPSAPDMAQSPNGFVSVVMPDGANPQSVIIFTPLNCPSDAAQRAEALSAQLTELGIAHVKSASYSSYRTSPTQEYKVAMDRTMTVLHGEIPAVFVHGMGKANPTAEEVLAEYQRAQ
jgi:hypothetical protein